MTRWQRLLTILWVGLLAIAANPIVAKERLTPELLWKLGRLSGAALSPDGSSVAYIVRRYELKENSGTSQLMLLDLQSGSQKELLATKSIGSLQWANSEQGARLWYIAPAENDTAQAWSLDPSNPAPQQVTQSPNGIGNLKVSPTATHIAYTKRVKLDANVQDLYPDLPKADARIIDQLMYRHWDHWHDYQYSHLHIAGLNDAGTAESPVDLMKGLRANCPIPPFGGAEQFNWAPDGKEISLTLKLVSNWAESTDSDVYLISLDQPHRRRCITAGMDGYDNDPVYSPDGRYLAFHSMKRAGFEADRNRIMLYDRGKGTITELTAGLDQMAHGSQWSSDSKSMYFMSEWRGTDQLFQIALTDKRAAQVTQGRFNWNLVSVFPDGNRLLVTHQNMLRPHELAVLNRGSKSTKPVTGINDKIYADLELPTIKERWVRSSDGELVHNWVIYPPGFDPEKKWPMLTYCQGGPQGQIGQWFSFRWNFHLMAANDYVIIAVNRRGLPGFGRKWNDAISRDWGGQAMQDILASTDDMMAEPFIDRDRVAAIGASFGGYTAYWLMGNHQDRFCTLISHAGVFNLESMYGSTEELFFVNWDLGGPYWKTAEIQKDYDRFSPHRFVGNWKTPLLVIHGEKDFRVPITQGMEAFTAAQVEGIPSRFLYFPNEGHWIMSPQNGVLWHRVFFDWLSRYCKPPYDSSR